MREKLIYLFAPFFTLLVFLNLIFSKRDYLEYLLHPYPRLVTLISMVLTIVIAFMGFFRQHLNNIILSKKIYWNIRSQLSNKFLNEKKLESSINHKLSGFLLAIRTYNNKETKYRDFLKNKSYEKFNQEQDKDESFFNEGINIINRAKEYDLVNYLADLSDFVNQLLWSPNANNLKASERKALLDFNEKVIELQYLILFLQIDTTKSKNGKLEKNQFLTICKPNNLITDSIKAEKLVKEIIKFYSNNTEPLD
ncbi:hypothetical protein [Mammaliicoccus sciuri]|uniref:hypothetical protein n=1 Tax=Mammaliicoccus sciuri TaxID=1296 RepID=UPI0021D3B9B8|nr:hypothetical protein [Mammaliicoccus sciuri]UXU70203.1 hypothetical protein MUA36_05840 [Mammaliicoccus sciuri]